MLSPLRNRFGIPGVISVVALVFAMLGGAYAANSSDNGATASAKKKAKKGPRGPKGATGPAGPAGPQGPAGANGKDGANGANGSNGAAGSDGQSVTTTVEAPFGECGEEEGVKLTSASGANYVCNGPEGPQGSLGPTGPQGAQGPTGPAGPEGNIGATLPGGTSMKGTWVAGPFTAGGAGEAVFTHISFNIPTSKAPSFYFMKEGENESPLFPEVPPTPAFHFCEGGVESPTVGTPEAINPGGSYACLFTQAAVNWDLARSAATFGVTGSRIVLPSNARKGGAVLKGESTGAGLSYAYGTWVVKTLPG
jgi:hypothetical protein